MNSISIRLDLNRRADLGYRSHGDWPVPCDTVACVMCDAVVTKAQRWSPKIWPQPQALPKNSRRLEGAEPQRGQPPATETCLGFWL